MSQSGMRSFPTQDKYCSQVRYTSTPMTIEHAPATLTNIIDKHHAYKDEIVKHHGKKERLKRTWKKQVEQNGVKVGLSRGDALCRSQWSVAVNRIAAGWRRIRPPSLARDATGC